MELKDINFCSLPVDQLKGLIGLLGIKDSETILSHECERKFIGEKCVEMKWNWYDEIIVTPDEIFFAPDPYPRSSVLNVKDLSRFENILTLIKNG